MAEVTKQLDGLGAGEQPESYSGFLTVDKNYDSNMFFWFVPATVSTKNISYKKLDFKNLLSLS